MNHNGNVTKIYTMRYRYIIFFIVVLNFSSVDASCQIETKYKNGTVFDSTRLIMQNDTCLFSLKENEIADWHLFVETKEGDWQEVLRELGNCSFEINVDDCNIKWFRAAKYIQPNDNNTYYKGFVVCDHKDCDTITLTFNLAPSKPILLEKNFLYDNFEMETLNFINPVCQFKVYTERCGTNIICSHTCYDPTDWKWEHREFCIADNLPVTPNRDNIYEAHSTWGWRQLITVISQNKYGYSQNSDTLFTCDFVSDQSIIDVLIK